MTSPNLIPISDPREQELVNDVFGEDEFRTAVTIWCDDHRCGFEEDDEPSDGWFATVRMRRPYGYLSSTYRLTPEMQAVVDAIMAEADCEGTK